MAILTPPPSKAPNISIRVKYLNLFQALLLEDSSLLHPITGNLNHILRYY